MVSNYKRKTDRQSWSEKNMEQAVQEVKSGSMGYKKASITFQVPQSTLERRVRGKNKRAIGASKCLGNFKTVLPLDLEKQLVDHALNLESMFFGVTPIDIRRIAFDLAEKNRLSHNFNANEGSAGKSWFTAFMKRHPQISLRRPEPTSAARARSFNKENVKSFFDLLEPLQEKFNYPARRVFNCDETGITTVGKKMSKVISLKGKRQVGGLSSAERGTLITLEICMSAAGTFVPPMFIFPRVRMKAELMDKAPPDAIADCHLSGWMQTDLFTKWFEHFLHNVKPTENDPVLLILDGHATHTKNIEFIDKARENYVTVLCLPPHCSHKMQPLDVSFMAPFSTYYSQEVARWLRSHPGRVVTQFQVAELVTPAFLKAATPLTAINGFQKTGIYPLNRDVFPEHEFMPASVTDIPLPPADNNCSMASQQNGDEARSLESPNSAAGDNDMETDRSIQSPEVNGTNRMCGAQTSSRVSPQDIFPIPRATMSQRPPRKRNHGKTVVITSSPYKNDLMVRQSSLKAKGINQNVNEWASTSTTTEDPKAKRKLVLHKGKKSKKDQCATNQSEDDTICFYCNGMFSQSGKGEGWIRCSGCLRWGHDDCAGVDENDSDFTCEVCRDL